MIDACMSDDFWGVETTKMIDACMSDDFWGVETTKMIDACVSDDFWGVETRKMIDACVNDFWGVETSDVSQSHDLYTAIYSNRVSMCDHYMHIICTIHFSPTYVPACDLPLP